MANIKCLGVVYKSSGFRAERQYKELQDYFERLPELPFGITKEGEYAYKDLVWHVFAGVAYTHNNPDDRKHVDYNLAIDEFDRLGDREVNALIETGKVAPNLLTKRAKYLLYAGLCSRWYGEEVRERKIDMLRLRRDMRKRLGVFKLCQ